MRGEAIQAVNNGLEVLIQKLREDPFALETVWLSIITFDRDVNVIFPLSELASVQLPEIRTPDSGPTHMGKALMVLLDQVRSEVRANSAETKGDWRPLLFLMTDGKPSDKALYDTAAVSIKELTWGAIIACSAGASAVDADLKKLTDKVVHLETMDGSTMMSFFKWVSESIGTGNRSIGAQDQFMLPPPPSEVHVII
jgi:uncharacterized protein YegL